MTDLETARPFIDVDLDAIMARYDEWTEENGRIALYSGGLTQEIAESAEDVPALVYEVERLTAELLAAQATITEALAVEPVGLAHWAIHRILNHVDTSALVEQDKRVAAEALEDAAVSLWGDSSAEPGTTKAQYNAIYATWLEQRAAR